MNELTERLSVEQPVVVGGPAPALDDFRRRLLEIGTVFIRFTETRGGTDLSVKVDRDACDTSAADFEAGAGTLHVEGTLTLNGDRVRCIADIDLAGLKGTGRLEVVREPEPVG